MPIGQVISGSFGDVVVRQKSNENIEIGDLFVIDSNGRKTILQAYDLRYGSQIGDLSRELISGMNLEGKGEMEMIEPELANYLIAHLKPVLTVENGYARAPKALPSMFSSIERITEKDLDFLSKPADAVYAGKIRSGSKTLDCDAFLPGREVFSHHILVASATGKGKSNLVKVMSASVVEQGFVSLLILDPHDEYYGRNGPGLKGKVLYYTTKHYPGASSLKINISKLRPSHFRGVVEFSDAQEEAMLSYYNNFGEDWIKELLSRKLVSERDEMGVRRETLEVLRRRFNALIGISYKDERLACKGIFDEQAGKTTIEDICDSLENGKSVVVDTSLLSSEIEVLVGSMLAKEIFRRYRNYKMKGVKKPIISVVIEEAPRVLGKDVLAKGSNVFSSIAREGRKFGIGLVAITQLPSLIPREILANINTKIILGIELSGERQSIIESAAQDLSKDDRNIASLDKGEAIITSNFTKFALPVKVPLFSAKNEEVRHSFAGML